MKKTEKIVCAGAIMLFGVLFILLKSDLMSVLVTILGMAVFVFGIIDIVNQKIAWAVGKLIFGALIIVCAWTLLEAVLYLLAAGLLVLGILLLYDLIRYKLNGISFRDFYCIIKCVCI